MNTLHTALRLASGSAMLVAMLASTTACWDIGEDVYAEGNYALTHSDTMRVYWGDELVAEIDPAVGGVLELGEWDVEYDEFCSDPEFSCPTEVYWDEVAIYQPLGTDNALLNAVNIGTVGEQGARLAGVVDAEGNFDLLLGLSASWNQNCLAVGISTSDGKFNHAALDRGENYDEIQDGTITITYAAGCEVLDGVILATSLSFESDFSGVRTGDVDTGDIEVDPAIDEDGDEVDDNLEEIKADTEV